jgi:hypothetical protein
MCCDEACRLPARPAQCIVAATRTGATTTYILVDEHSAHVFLDTTPTEESA